MTIHNEYVNWTNWKFYLWSPFRFVSFTGKYTKIFVALVIFWIFVVRCHVWNPPLIIILARLRQLYLIRAIHHISTLFTNWKHCISMFPWPFSQSFIKVGLIKKLYKTLILFFYIRSIYHTNASRCKRIFEFLNLIPQLLHNTNVVFFHLFIM